MKIYDTAFLIPVHPPKYTHVYEMINSFRENNICIDLYTVFSNNEDYQMFLMKDYIKPIIVSGSLNNKSIITFKKFYGLKHLANSSYEYIIVCDSETTIIPENFTSENITEKLSNIFTNKKIYAGDISQLDDASTKDFLTSITRSCASLFSGSQYEHLRNITNNFNLYFWWSDIPVYKREHLVSFFNIIDYTNIEYVHFDHVIYQLYMVIKEDFQIVDTTPITNTKWSLEMLDTDNLDILSKLLTIDYGFGWVTKKMYRSRNYNFLMINKTLLIYHLDR
ncbi:MAG: hypothetical protein EBU66_17420 [Bacteroidetes bacterium]|nr:hypothetical protein [Bacteroidota bacterium]